MSGRWAHRAVTIVAVALTVLLASTALDIAFADQLSGQAPDCAANEATELAIIVDPLNAEGDVDTGDLASVVLRQLLEDAASELDAGWLSRVLVFGPAEPGTEDPLLLDTDTTPMDANQVAEQARVLIETGEFEFGHETADERAADVLDATIAAEGSCTSPTVIYITHDAVRFTAPKPEIWSAVAALDGSDQNQIAGIEKADTVIPITSSSSLPHLRRYVNPRLWSSNDVGPDLDASASSGDDVVNPIVASWYLEADQKPIVLAGYSSRLRASRDIPPGWQPVGPASLDLRYQASQLAAFDSTLVVAVDGAPLFTDLMGDRQSIEVDSSKSLPDESFEVTLATSTPLTTDQECVDPNHVGRWIEIEEGARIQSVVEFAEPTINNYIQSAAEVSSLTGRPITFVVSVNPDRAVIESIGIIAAALRSEGAIDDLDVVIGSRAEVVDGPTVVVTATDSDAESAKIAVNLRSGWPVLSVSGPSELLVSASRTINDRLFAPVLDVATAEVGSTYTADVRPPESLFTLEQLGFRDRTVRGTGEHSMGYDFDIPIEWQPSEVRIRVVGSFAASLSTVDTDLGISINGQAVGSTTLVDETGRIDTTIAVPPSVLRSGKNFLRFSVDLGTIPLICGGLASTDRWLSIQNATTVSVLFESGRNALDLGDLPWLLAEQSDSGALDIVLPADLDADDLKAALELLVSVSSGGSGAAPRLTIAGAVDETRHLIVIGTRANQPMLDLLDPFLTIDLSAGAPDRFEGVVGAESGGALELLWSPWANRRVVLVATGSTDAGVHHALQHLINEDLRTGLGGSAMLVGALSSQAIDVSAPEALALVDDLSDDAVAEYEGWLRDQATAPFDPATAPIDLATRRVFAAVIASALTLAAGVGVIRRRRRGEDDDDAHGEDDDPEGDDGDGDDPDGDDGDGSGDGDDDGPEGNDGDGDGDDDDPEGDGSDGDGQRAGVDAVHEEDTEREDESMAAVEDHDGVDPDDVGTEDEDEHPSSTHKPEPVARVLNDQRDEHPPAVIDLRNKARLDLRAHVRDAVIDLRDPPESDPARSTSPGHVLIELDGTHVPDHRQVIANRAQQYRKQRNLEAVQEETRTPRGNVESEQSDTPVADDTTPTHRSKVVALIRRLGAILGLVAAWMDSQALANDGSQGSDVQ